MTQILLVDDDDFTRKLAVRVLDEAGFEVTEANSGSAALDLITRQKPDLIALDIVMPEMDGYEVCRRIRADPYFDTLPIIFLTSKRRPEDVAMGLDVGGDDFVIKSRAAIELPARIRALLRRVGGGTLDPETEWLEAGDLKLHMNEPQLYVKDTLHILTPIKYRLMRYLMSRQGQPVSIDQLLEDVWEYPPGTGDPKLVRVHIAYLRNELEPVADDPRYLLNVRGRGYMIRG